MNNPHVALFVVGPPGVGKTAALRSILPFYYDLHPNPKWTLSRGVALVGHYGSGTFDGGDTVPYNGGASAVNFWRQEVAPKIPLAIFDGDRFSHAGAMRAVECVEGVTAACVHLFCDETALAERRAARGNTQNASWMAGRVTKAKRFAGLFPVEHHLDLDTSLMSIADVAASLLSFALAQRTL